MSKQQMNLYLKKENVEWLRECFPKSAGPFIDEILDQIREKAEKVETYEKQKLVRQAARSCLR